MDLKARKLMTNAQGLISKRLTEKDYMCRENKKEEDLLALKMNTWTRGLHFKKQILITVASYSIDNERINRTTKTRKRKWGEKQQNRYFMRETDKIAHDMT